MCRPPDLSPRSSEDEPELGAGEDGWVEQPGQPALAWDWNAWNHASGTGLAAVQGPSVGAVSHAEHQSETSKANTTTRAQALILQYGQQQQQQLLLKQQQEQQRMAQLAAFAAAKTPANPFHASLLQSYAQKIGAAGAHKPEQVAYPWLGDRQPMPAVEHPWVQGGNLAASAALLPAAQLVASGIPVGITPFIGEQHDEEDEEVDPKKYKRMMSNRASAKRSRQRRQERLDELEIVSAKLRVENSTVQRRLNEANEQIKKLQEQNEGLQHELERLQSMVHGGAMMKAVPTGTVRTGTNQDSCGADGSISEKLSSQSSEGRSTLGKRSREEEESDVEVSGGVTLQNAEGGGVRSPRTPSSGVTAQPPKHAGGAAAAPTAALPACGLEHGKIELLGQDGGLLDDDLFSHFMDECFEPKHLEERLC